MNYEIRPMKRIDLDIAINWAAKEGWNPGLYDGDSFYETDPNGFFMGFLGNKPISCISAVSYNKKFGFLGFYIVKPEYRGNGYGIQIWNRAIEYLNTQNIGLDGVVAQQENYKKSGFTYAYRNIRFMGKSREKKNFFNKNIVALNIIPFDKVVEYDTNLFPSPRPQFLKRWICLPDSLSIGVLNRNKLVGYTVIRKCTDGYKIGPLFADDKKLAQDLLISLMNYLPPSSNFFLDVPEINSHSVQLAKIYGMNKCFETARMYTKKIPDIDMQKVFGVTSYELG